MTLIARLVAVLAAPMMLASCVLTPGKFTSTLTILADRSFTFTYAGEVYALNDDGAMKSLMSDSKSKDKPDPAEAARRKAETEAHNQAIAEALRKEEGYRRVDYMGDGRFVIDYAISGSLNHAFVFPFNADAEAVLPFLTVELRKDGMVRVAAPGFANDSTTTAGMPMPGGDVSSKLDGTFTLSTDATIVSQNNEDGARTANGRQTISWRATPLTKTAPRAVLKLGAAGQ